jgi:hypothetical protein
MLSRATTIDDLPTNCSCFDAISSSTSTLRMNVSCPMTSNVPVAKRELNMTVSCNCSHAKQPSRSRYPKNDNNCGSCYPDLSLGGRKRILSINVPSSIQPGK